MGYDNEEKLYHNILWLQGTVVSSSQSFVESFIQSVTSKLFQLKKHILVCTLTIYHNIKK